MNGFLFRLIAFAHGVKTAISHVLSGSPVNPDLRTEQSSQWNPEREARLAVAIDSYSKMLVNTASVNRPDAESKVTSLYRESGCKPPLKYFWFQSPAQGSVAILLISLYEILKSEGLREESLLVLQGKLTGWRSPAWSLMHKMYDSLKAPFKDPLDGDVRSYVFDQELNHLLQDRTLTRMSDLSGLSDDLLSGHEGIQHLSHNILAIVERNITDELMSFSERQNPLSIWLDVWKMMDEACGDATELRNDLYIIANAIWSLDEQDHTRVIHDLIMSSLDVMGYSHGPHDVIRLLESEIQVILEKKRVPLLERLRDTVGACGFWWPSRSVCIMVERPAQMHVNQSMLLHNNDGMALSYGDEWGVFALNGITVPENVARGRFTTRDIDSEMNIEVQRVMIERYGVGEYLTDTGASEIHRDDFGVLYRKDMMYEPIVVVKVTNKTSDMDGTFREYFIRVPPDVSTAKEAVAWSFGMETREYQPVKET